MTARPSGGAATRRRLLQGIAGAAAAAAWPGFATAQITPLAFARFLEELWPDASRAGIGRPTFDRAVAGITFDPKVAALTGRQGEFSRPIADYVEGASSGARLAKGRDLARRWAELLISVERRTGVPGSVVLAIWGMESEFGASAGDLDVIRSLATLAALGFRGTLFRDELIAAMLILEGEHIGRAALKGSWAGAMGQTQFMPSSFLKHAVDGDGDGRRDIWNSAPDALASIATFLAASGWRRGLPWGFEVRMPPGLDLRLHRRGLAEWASLGLASADGSAMPASGSAQLVFFAGIAGPALLLTENFEAIRAYNTSDAYALAAGRLADRIGGAGPFARPWPKTAALNAAERHEVHRRLAGLGLYAGTTDGKFGAQTRDAVRRFQIARGMVPDGYADIQVLATLRAGGG